MNYKLIGIQELNFDMDNGQHYQGFKLYVCTKNEYVQGLEADFVSIRADLLKGFNPYDFLNKDVLIYFNKKGKVVLITGA